MILELNNFVNRCRAYRSSETIDIENYFRRHLARKARKLKANNRFPITEKDLQTYLYLNIKSIFPECKELLLYERPLLDKHSTNTGRFDFVYLTKNRRLKLIETKVIDTNATGATAQTRRRKHRQKIVEQVSCGKYQLCNLLRIPEKKVECAVYTTDPLFRRRLYGNSLPTIDNAFISLNDLKVWFENVENYQKIDEETLDFNYLLDMQDFGWP